MQKCRLAFLCSLALKGYGNRFVINSAQNFIKDGIRFMSSAASESMKEVSVESQLPNKFSLDIQYQMVKQQNFGPVFVDKSNLSYKPTREYAKRPHLVFDGVPYHQLPIVDVSARWNNTLISVYEPGRTKFYTYVSCRKVGFFHAKKKTDLAGEMTGKAAAQKAIEQGCGKYARLIVKGIGPGRKSSIQGVVQGGITIVSISDVTPLTMKGLPQRPRKIRRL